MPPDVVRFTDVRVKGYFHCCSNTTTGNLTTGQSFSLGGLNVSETCLWSQYDARNRNRGWTEERLTPRQSTVREETHHSSVSQSQSFFLRISEFHKGSCSLKYINCFECVMFLEDIIYYY